MIIFASNTSWCLLLEDDTKNYGKPAHQTNTMYIRPGAGEQTPISRYPEKIHQANKKNWKKITQNIRLSNHQDIRCSPNIFSHLIALFRCTAPVNPGEYRILGNPEATSGPTKPHKSQNWKRNPSTYCCFLDSKKDVSKCFKNQTPGS